MARKYVVSVLAVLALGAGGAAFAQVPANISKAVADPSRPAEQSARDAARHPGEVLALAGVKTGDTVVDFIMGGGYFTRILSGAVGPKGTVYAYQPAEFIKFKAKYGEDQASSGLWASSLKPAASTSFFTASTSMRCSVSGAARPEPAAAAWSTTRKTPPGFSDLKISASTLAAVSAGKGFRCMS